MNEKSEKELDELYRKFGPLIYRRCLTLLKNEEQAVDAMQDVFVRVLEQQTKIRKISSSILYVISTRICLNKIRSEKIRSCCYLGNFEEILADGSQIEEEILSKVLIECIFQKRNFLDRQIAILHYVDGLTYEETAFIAKMSVSGVRKRLQKLKDAAVKKFECTRGE